MIKNDRWIRDMALKGMIEPFEKEQVKKGVISFGVSSYGYDMRITEEFKIYQAIKNTVLDPKNLGKESFVDFHGNSCIVPPNSFVLAKSVEYFRIPRDVLAICFGKSTYARCGIFVNVTPLEPEWEGHVTLSISNTSPSPTKIYAKEGIAQILFLGAQEICETSYADKAGKYQDQKRITLSKM
jgi:dCTP deaminase